MMIAFGRKALRALRAFRADEDFLWGFTHPGEATRWLVGDAYRATRRLVRHQAGRVGARLAARHRVRAVSPATVL